MGSGRRSSARAFAAVIPVVIVLGISLAPTAATGAGAESQPVDAAIARAGIFVASDFPTTFQVLPGQSAAAGEVVKLARGADGCGPYVTLLKASVPRPQARSLRFGDAARAVSNEVGVYPSERAASVALTLYAKSSVVGCIENLAEKQLRQDAAQDAAQDAGRGGTIDEVVAKLDRRDIAGLGDDSVVYEGSIVVTGTDGSTTQVGVGNAAVRVGRAVDVVTYTSTGTDLTDVLAPAIDSSVARLRSAQAKGPS